MRCDGDKEFLEVKEHDSWAVKTELKINDRFHKTTVEKNRYYTDMFRAAGSE